MHKAVATIGNPLLVNNFFDIKNATNVTVVVNEREGERNTIDDQGHFVKSGVITIKKGKKIKFMVATWCDQWEKIRVENEEFDGWQEASEIAYQGAKEVSRFITESDE